jgi:hypothetical protein
VISFGLYLSIAEGMFLYNWSMHNIFKFLALTLRYLGMTVKNQTLIQEEIKRRLNSGNAFYNPVQNLSSSCLLSKNLKIRIYKTVILPVVLYGCETWSDVKGGTQTEGVSEHGAEENIWTEER